MGSIPRLEVVIAVIYLIIILVVKTAVLDKKFDKNKSESIYNILNALVIPYFLVLGQWSLAVIVLIVIIWQNIVNKKRNARKK